LARMSRGSTSDLSPNPAPARVWKRRSGESKRAIEPVSEHVIAGYCADTEEERKKNYLWIVYRRNRWPCQIFVVLLLKTVSMSMRAHNFLRQNAFSIPTCVYWTNVSWNDAKTCKSRWFNVWPIGAHLAIMSSIWPCSVSQPGSYPFSDCEKSGTGE
jgi:hypothetical protein